MLLATLLVLAVTAAVFAVTQIGALVTLLFVIAVLVLAYKRLPLLAFSIVFSILFVIYTWFGAPGGLWKGLLLLMLVVMWLFNIRPLRKALISRPFLKAYLRMLPTMSDTERDALEAGGVWWDGELFTGKPDWSKLLGTPAPRLTPEEQAFLDGPTEELCALVNDFDVTHRRADLSPEAWEFIKRERFWSMIIPKQYGGLGFGAMRSPPSSPSCRAAASRSGSPSVPNSLGPGELLVHYGTEEQKNHYLPRLARGEEIPCFGLTSPRGRFRCRLDHRYRRGVPRLLAGARVRRHPPELLQALHHARARGHGHRPCLPAVRSRAPDRHHRRHRHHLRADPARHGGHPHRPSPLSAEHPVPERPHPGRGCVHPGRFHHRWRGAWRARAGAC
jgi:hypothetical protein